MGNLGCNIITLISILRDKEFEIASYVMSHHNYKNIQKTTMKEKLEARMESDNIMDTFAVAVLTSETIVRYIMKRKTGRFAKTIFYLLKASTCHKYFI